MVDLPVAPRLELEETPTNADMQAPLAKVSPPLAVVEAVPIPTLAPAPALVAAPPTVARPPTPARNPPAPFGEPVRTEPIQFVDPSVDEVLHQASEQTVRLAHLEDHFRLVGRSVDDLREEMVAGFSEMRGVVEQGRDAMFRVESSHAEAANTMQQRLTGRLDAVEDQAQKTHKKQGLILLVMAGQVLLAALAVWFLLGVRAELTEARAQLAAMSSSDNTAATDARHASPPAGSESTVAPSGATGPEGEQADAANKRRPKAKKRVR